MKKIFLLLSAVYMLCSCNQIKPSAELEANGSDNTAATAVTSYGAAFAEKYVISATELQQAVSGKDSVQATVTAEVVESCQAKGCWMDVKLNDSTAMKVTFRDYGFFVPVEDLQGKTAVFTGTAKREVISVEDQRHYAKDAGKPDAEVQRITQPKEELRFVADGVILK